MEQEHGHTEHIDYLGTMAGYLCVYGYAILCAGPMTLFLGPTSLYSAVSVSFSFDLCKAYFHFHIRCLQRGLLLKRRARCRRAEYWTWSYTVHKARGRMMRPNVMLCLFLRCRPQDSSCQGIRAHLQYSKVHPQSALQQVPILPSWASGHASTKDRSL